MSTRAEVVKEGAKVRNYHVVIVLINATKAFPFHCKTKCFPCFLHFPGNFREPNHYWAVLNIYIFLGLVRHTGSPRLLDAVIRRQREEEQFSPTFDVYPQ